jgi:hypothetical protein
MNIGDQVQVGMRLGIPLDAKASHGKTSGETTGTVNIEGNLGPAVLPAGGVALR